MLRVSTFSEWRDHMLATTPPDAIVTCPLCEGEGVITGECECCGHEAEDPCQDCAAAGALEFGSINGKDLQKVFTHDQYMAVLEKDLVALAEWINTDISHLAVKSGFTVFQTVRDKKLHIREV